MQISRRGMVFTRCGLYDFIYNNGKVLLDYVKYVYKSGFPQYSFTFNMKRVSLGYNTPSTHDVSIVNTGCYYVCEASLIISIRR